MKDLKDAIYLWSNMRTELKSKSYKELITKAVRDAIQERLKVRAGRHPGGNLNFNQSRIK